MIERKDSVINELCENSSSINKSLVKQYEEQGFLILVDVFSEKEIVSFQQKLDHLKKDKTFSRTEQNITEFGCEDIRSIFKDHDSSTVFENLAREISLARLA